MSRYKIVKSNVLAGHDPAFDEWKKNNPNASYADDLLWIADQIGKAEIPFIEVFIDPFDMIPDVRAKIVRLTETDRVFHTNFHKNALPRIITNIKYALKHNGSTLINIYGATRHGKSTVARFLAQLLIKLRHGTLDNWEEKIIYEQSYSGSTNRLMKRIQELKDQGLTQKQVIEALHGQVIIHDEVLIEHEKDSVKAREDIINLIETCAAAQIDFIFVTPNRREFGQFSLWTVGIDPKTQTNLSFYFDKENHCFGCLESPNTPETEHYQQIKYDGIFDLLSAGGRRIAEVKIFTEDLHTKTHNTIEGTAPEHLLDNLIQSLELKPTKHLQRNITIFKKVTVQGLSVGKVAKDHGLTDARVYQILGAINQAVGITFEKYLETIQPKLWVRQGGKSQPDLINEQHKFVVSCKVMYGNKPKKIDKALRNSKPEYTYIKQGYTGYLIIFWIDDNSFTIEPML